MNPSAPLDEPATPRSSEPSPAPPLRFLPHVSSIRSGFALAIDARLLGLSAGVGAIAGLVATVYFYALEYVGRGVHWFEGHTGLPVWAVMALGGVAVGCFYWLGEPGETDAVVNNIHVENGRVELHANVPLIPISLTSIAFGGSAGPEAPMVHLTGSVGTWLHKVLDLPEKMVRPLTFAGMSVGFATLFGAPIGSAVFALEIPHKRGMEYYEALVPAMIGSLVGYSVFSLLTHHGIGTVWTFNAYQFAHWSDLLKATGVGLGAGLAAIPFVGLIRWTKRIFTGVHLPMPLKCAIGGLMLGLLAWHMPETRFYGESVVDDVARGSEQSMYFLLMLAGLKMLAVALTLACGWRGGIIIPCFLIGACLGKAFAMVIPGLDPTLAMACGMCAVNIAVMKVPLGTILVLVTMTGVNAIAPIALAGMAAFLVSGGANVIDTKRDRVDAEDEVPAEA